MICSPTSRFILLLAGGWASRSRFEKQFDLNTLEKDNEMISRNLFVWRFGAKRSHFIILKMLFFVLVVQNFIVFFFYF